MAIPPAIFNRIKIIEELDSPKSVSFSDLNPVKSFYYNDPPALLMEKNEIEKLKAHIKLLESQLDRAEQEPVRPVISPLAPEHFNAVRLVQKPIQPPIQKIIENPIEKPTVEKTPSKAYQVCTMMKKACLAAAVLSAILCVFVPPAGAALIALSLGMALVFHLAAKDYQE